MERAEQKRLKYHQIIEDLKEEILSGKLEAGDKLPSENALAMRYRVSRQTVRKAIADLANAGYVYAEHGRGTFCSELVKHSRTSRNIAVVTTYWSDYIFPQVIGGIDSVLTKNDYSIILKNTRNSRSREVKVLAELLKKDIEGVIIEPSKSQIYCKHLNLYEKMEEYHIPYVFIQGSIEQMTEKPQVVMDDCKGGYLVTRYLIEQGHKNIVGIFKADDSQGVNRHRGFVKALQEAGMNYEPEKVIWFYTEDREIHPYQSIKRLVKNDNTIDGIVCYNDQIASSVIQALQEERVKVPEDVSVTGYDNSQLANAAGVKLTTIAHPQEKLGEMAAELLLELIHNRGDDSNTSKKVLIEPELVIGDSCKKRK